MTKKGIFTTVIALIVIIALYLIVVSNLYPRMPERGSFGDSFGGLSALFSGLAFLGVVYAIFLQREELALQRKELELTRQELKRTAESQEKSEKALSKQAASLKITAKLNGLSAILQHHNSLLETTNSAKYGIDHHAFNKHKQDAERVIREIEQLIEPK